MPLLTWFESQKNKRHTWHAIERAWIDALPEWENRADLNAAMLKHLRDLEAQGLVQFPKTTAMWSRGAPSCPEWCLYVPQESAKIVFQYAGPWHARMGFNTLYKGDTLELLAQINAFLLTQDRFDYLVPLKERSLQICGDEKRLDGFRLGSNTHLFKGMLALEHIGAFHAEAPLTYEICESSTSTQGLIVENQDSYYSFRQWNKKTSQYRAIVYGSGNAFSSSYRNLLELQRDHGVTLFEYLGDVDVAGFQIPERVASSLAPGQLLPALQWYRWLLQHGTRRPLKVISGEPRALGPWLEDVALRGDVEALWASGYWIPQESLGLDSLRSMVSA